MTDLRYAARTLAKTPGFTLVVVGLLAIGIAATTVVFSFVDAILLRPLPVPRPQELVRIVQWIPQAGGTSFAFPYFPYSLYQTLSKHSTTLSAVFGEISEQAVITNPGLPEQIRVHLVTPEFFTTLGVPALYGRILTPADAAATSDTPPAILSHAFWLEHFAANPHVIGQTITIHGHSFVVAGIMPANFNGTSADTSPEVRVPLRCLSLFALNGQNLSNITLEIAGRVKPGLTLAQAQAESLVI